MVIVNKYETYEKYSHRSKKGIAITHTTKKTNRLMEARFIDTFIVVKELIYIAIKIKTED